MNFLKDGFKIFPEVLSPSMIERLKRECEELIALKGASHRFKYRGINIPIDGTLYIELLSSLPDVYNCFSAEGFSNFRFESAYLVSKPPHYPALYWHQDWAYWDEFASSMDRPRQLLALFYLEDTTPHNGCLRVIPGSNLKRNFLHGRIGVAHSETTDEAEESSILFKKTSDTLDIPLKAGDMVLADSRLLHSTYPNDSDKSRNNITLIFYDSYFKKPDKVERIPGIRLGGTSILGAVYYRWKARLDRLAFKGKRRFKKLFFSVLLGILVYGIGSEAVEHAFDIHNGPMTRKEMELKIKKCRENGMAFICEPYLTWGGDDGNSSIQEVTCVEKLM